MKMKDILGCIAGSSILLLASVWIPVVGAFFAVLAPLPFLYYSTKTGLVAGIKVAGVAVLCLSAFSWLMGLRPLVFFAIEFALVGLTLAELFRRGFSLGKTVTLGTVMMLLLGLGFFLAFSRKTMPTDLMIHYLDGHLKEVLRTYEETGGGREGSRELEAYARSLMHILSRIYPALMVIGTAFAVWVNVVVARPLFRIMKVPYPDFGAVDQWRSPDWMVWGVIGSGFSLFFLSGVIGWFALNVLIALMTVYLFHGLSILLFFLNKYHVPVWARAGLYGILIVQQLSLGLLALAGLFDQWIDFRRLQRKREG